MDLDELTPLLKRRAYDQPSVFTAENLLREARRQKGLEAGDVPALCVLDPDGDLLDHLHKHHHTQLHPTWACYHTTLYTVTLDGWEFGLIGRVVGAPFAVLVAEELFASGCRLLVSITLVLTQKKREGKLERVDLHRKGRGHAEDSENLYERI